MTGPGVECMPHTAYPMPSVSPAGISTLMPPHIQGAERRTESRARRTRWGLRVLVVGGLAGAVWLLTGAAAHAADRADGPTGPLLGSVVGGDATMPVTGLLRAAAQPLETVTPTHEHHVVASVLDVPRRVLTRPAETLDEVTHGTIGTQVDIAFDTVDLALAGSRRPHPPHRRSDDHPAAAHPRDGARRPKPPTGRRPVAVAGNGAGTRASAGGSGCRGGEPRSDQQGPATPGHRPNGERIDRTRQDHLVRAPAPGDRAGGAGGDDPRRRRTCCTTAAAPRGRQRLSDKWFGDTDGRWVAGLPSGRDSGQHDGLPVAAGRYRCRCPAI